jgi:hypothetical protein
MQLVRETQKKYCSRAMAAAVLAAVAFIAAGRPDLGKGLVAGTLAGVVNFILIGESLLSKIGRTRRAATAVSFAWILLRYVLLALPLVLALKFELFNPVTAACGLFLVQAVILTEHVFSAVSESLRQRP